MEPLAPLRGTPGPAPRPRAVLDRPLQPRSKAMSNAGKRMINWKREFPVVRTALGLLGRDGFTSKQAATILLAQEQMAPVHRACKMLGRVLNEEVIVSRLKRPHEVDWIQEKDPKSFRLGKNLKMEWASTLKKSGVHPFGVLG